MLTSLGFHLLFARRDAASERAQHTARISILESLVERLREGEPIADAEIEKLTNLSRKLQSGNEGNGTFIGDEHQGRIGVTWKEAFIGRQTPTSGREDM